MSALKSAKTWNLGHFLFFWATSRCSKLAHRHAIRVRLRACVSYMQPLERVRIWKQLEQFRIQLSDGIIFVFAYTWQGRPSPPKSPLCSAPTTTRTRRPCRSERRVGARVLGAWSHVVALTLSKLHKLGQHTPTEPLPDFITLHPLFCR